jgi:Rieske Fe-S protein
MTQHAATETTDQNDLTAAQPAAPATPSRRRVLATSGAVVAAAAVTAACGSTSSGSSSGTDAGTGSGTGSSPSAAAAAAAKADVPVGGGVILADRKVVITQPAAGTFKAFTAVCTHQGCVVSSVSDNKINCACHGSVFSAEDGSVQQGPASSPLTAVNVTVAGDQITVA